MLSSPCGVFAYDKGSGIEVLVGYDTDYDKVYITSCEVAIRGYGIRHNKTNEKVTYPYAPWWFKPSYEGDRELWDVVMKSKKISDVRLNKVKEVVETYRSFKKEIVDALIKLGVSKEEIDKILEA